MTTTGKKARKHGGNRYALKRRGKNKYRNRPNQLRSRRKDADAS